MSRAYRIRVRESLRRTVRAGDRVSTTLEVLEILPPEQMAELLRQELKGRGFREQGGKMVRQQKGITIAVDPENGTVTASSELTEKVELAGEREARVYTDVGPGAEKSKKELRASLRGDLEKEAKEREEDLQRRATDKLEAELSDLRQELNQAVNRVTAEALKRKAAQLGQIKEMSEDRERGELTIVVEV
jgi:hypothetical protein